MSYASILASARDKRPIWLYEFVRDGTTTRLAASVKDYLDSSAVTWTASPITHDRFRLTSGMERAETKIVFPQSNAFARTYLTDLSYSSNSVTIYHEFKNQSPEARVIKFRGRVKGVEALFTRLILVAENRFTEARRKALHSIMQHPCRHALYHQTPNGYGCGVDINSYYAAGTLTAISGSVVDVSSASGQADGYYAGGVFNWSGKLQMITAHTGTQLTLLGPVDGMEAALTAAGSAGLSVQIAPGCDRTRAICSSRFNNLNNHGGFPWMDESPFDGKTLY